MYLRKKIRLVVVLLLIFLSVPWRRLRSPNPTQILKLLKVRGNTFSSGSEHISIGMMVCMGGFRSSGKGPVESKAINDTVEEPLTLIKSVLISAKVWKVGRIEFHILTDSWLITETMQSQIDKFSGTLKDYVKITAKFYNVYRSIPPGYERDFVDNRKLCGYVRIFLPDCLPASLKEILYLDTDVIITGNIANIWNEFKTSVVTKVMSSNHSVPLAALVQNSEVFGNTYLDVYKDHFRWIPHVRPRGVNSGVIFMNLNAMRQFRWTTKILEIYKSRRNSLKGDQQLINIFFHDHMNRLVQFPCQYNFQHLHCDMGLTCKNVTSDPRGIQIMHGAGNSFHTKGHSHVSIYEAFKAFNLELHEKVKDRLFKPLQKLYSKAFVKPGIESIANCNGRIGKYLFPDISE